MEKVAQNIKASIDVAANETQKKMLQHYFNSFKTGSIEEHIKSQECWLQDINPHVETNIGKFFIYFLKQKSGLLSFIVRFSFFITTIF